jgi:UDP-GlcNAc:undecaprenyl-phosphate GlcNAc-1-phosphate transferase
MTVLWPALGAFGLAVLMTIGIKPVALAAGVVAVPKSDRWHRGRIPLLGGVAIAGAVLLTAALVPGLFRQAWLLLAGAAVLAVVGLIDDTRPIRPQTKLVAQLLVAAALAGSGLTLGLTDVVALDQLITVVWLVGCRTPSTCSTTWTDWRRASGSSRRRSASSSSFRTATSGRDAGRHPVRGPRRRFLVFNFQPASIFMATPAASSSA